MQCIALPLHGSRTLYATCKVVQKRDWCMSCLPNEFVHQFKGSNRQKSLFVTRCYSHIVEIQDRVQRKTRGPTAKCTSRAHRCHGTSRGSNSSTFVSMFCFGYRFEILTSLSRRILRLFGKTSDNKIEPIIQHDSQERERKC